MCDLYLILKINFVMFQKDWIWTTGSWSSTTSTIRRRRTKT